LIPKDIHILILGTWEYVALHNKRCFADRIKVIDFKVGGLFWMTEVDPV
jgi:hypothetical protein